MTKPFPATACQQSRQWVISGPLVGNVWSTRFALEHAIAGGAACAATDRQSRDDVFGSLRGRRVSLPLDVKGLCFVAERPLHLRLAQRPLKCIFEIIRRKGYMPAIQSLDVGYRVLREVHQRARADLAFRTEEHDLDYALVDIDFLQR